MGISLQETIVRHVACDDGYITQMDGWMTVIGWLRFVDDAASLHVEIDNLNDSLVGFYFIRDIDKTLMDVSIRNPIGIMIIKILMWLQA
jgi:hypothetical protein